MRALDRGIGGLAVVFDPAIEAAPILVAAAQKSAIKIGGEDEFAGVQTVASCWGLGH